MLADRLPSPAPGPYSFSWNGRGLGGRGSSRVEPLRALISFSGGGGVKAGSWPGEISHPRKASFLVLTPSPYPADLWVMDAGSPGTCFPL